ncbi:MAG TPA: DUF1080 domain-containing protein [Gemmatimonadales bacterium]|nr:DUF1080 domain-containing protein [Gemmatimonadales bacterium]
MSSFLLLALLQAGVAGRWDLTLTEGASVYPMWVEVLAGPPAGGRLQGRFGYALPLRGVVIDSNRIRFPMPTEQPVSNPAQFSAVVEGDNLTGEIVSPTGSRIRVAGLRAPSLSRSRSPEWLEPRDLLASGLAGWRLEDPDAKSQWAITNGELVNSARGTNLITNDTYTDFKLHIEVNVPADGNSGIYLRGRHEVQVDDSYGKSPSILGMGGIFGLVAPWAQPARPPGEWQAFDITLIGRRVTVVLNGTTMLDNAEIPGITGGALDSAEGSPGPIMLQGDHTAIRYRNIRITPAR